VSGRGIDGMDNGAALTMGVSKAEVTVGAVEADDVGALAVVGIGALTVTEVGAATVADVGALTGMSAIGAPNSPPNRFGDAERDGRSSNRGVDMRLPRMSDAARRPGDDGSDRKD
jgi:hypothetical protein